jgi:hypothetical protein
MLVFLTQLCELLLLSHSLWFNSPPTPVPCVNKYTEYMYTVCKGGGMGFRALDDKNLLQSPVTGHFLDYDILQCLL